MLLVSRLSILVSAAAAAVLTLSAQRIPQATALCCPSALMSPFLAPISGVPVTATFTISEERPESNGSTDKLRSTFKAARDSKGRISRELREFVSTPFAGAPSLLGEVLYDPHTQMSQTIDAMDKTDVEIEVGLHPPVVSGEKPVSASGRVQIDDLGTKTIFGFNARGIRETWNSSGQLSAGRPSQFSVESWYSDDLHMIVAERRTNPLGRVVVITLSSIDRQRPAASLFKVPKGYWVIRQKQHTVTTFVGNTWLIPAPDYDPNDGNGGFGYPSTSLTPVPGR